MNSDKTETPEILSLLPDSPITESKLDELQEDGTIKTAIPMKMYKYPDEYQIYDFAAECETMSYALRYEDNEWFVVASDEKLNQVAYALRDYHEEHENEQGSNIQPEDLLR